MKKLFTLLVAALMTVACCLGLTACGPKENPYEGIIAVDYSEMKVGLICLHSGDGSTYDKNFIDAFKVACENKGITSDRYFIKAEVDENNEAYQAAVELVEQGCNLIFADSFGHEEFILKAAKEFPKVQFCHATGVSAASTQRGNFHNAFANIFEGRYLAGVAAGLKLQAMIEDNANISKKVGYVAAHPYAEVISGYTSWYLGVKSIVSDVTMEVTYTNSWWDQTGEKAAAEMLIERGCSIISQHADSMGAPGACEENNVPNVSYNGSTEEQCPNTFIVSSRINWAPYYEYCMDCLKNGTEIAYDYSEGFGEGWNDGSVCLTDLGAVAPVEGTADVINAKLAMLKDGTLKVFDVSTFTVNGQALTAADNAMIKTVGGITFFDESSTISAPSFSYIIDGITVLSSQS